MSGIARVETRPARRLWTGAAVAWTILILVLCFLPADWLGVAAVEEGFFRIPMPAPDKVVHFTLFAGFAVLWTLASWPRRAAVAVAAAGLALAVGTELGQNLPIVARDGNLLDALADSLGVLAGATLAPVYLGRREAATAGRVSEQISS